MLSDIKQRHFGCIKIFSSTLNLFIKKFWLISIFIFLITVCNSLLGNIRNLLYVVLLCPAITVFCAYIVKAEIEDSTIVYSKIWKLYRNKIFNILTLYLLIFMYLIFLAAIFYGLGFIAYLLSFLLDLDLSSLPFDVYVFSGIGVLIFGLIAQYFFQHSFYAVILKSKYGDSALKHSAELVKSRPIENLIIIPIIFGGTLIANYLLAMFFSFTYPYTSNYLGLWIYAFTYQMVISFFVTANIIWFLNIDYLHDRTKRIENRSC